MADLQALERALLVLLAESKWLHSCLLRCWTMFADSRCTSSYGPPGGGFGGSPGWSDLSADMRDCSADIFPWLFQIDSELGQALTVADRCRSDRDIDERTPMYVVMHFISFVALESGASGDLLC